MTLAWPPDTDLIRKAGLMQPGWEDNFPSRSMPYVSTIVFVFPKGNPKGIYDWADLARPDVAAITPNPKTSGNGKWSFLALWGSVAWRGGTEDQARDFVRSVYPKRPGTRHGGSRSHNVT